MVSELRLDPPLKIIDMLAALIERDRVEEAVDLQLDAIIFSVERDLEVLDVLELTIDEFCKLYTPPKRLTLPAVRGHWDKVIYGAAALGDDDE